MESKTSLSKDEILKVAIGIEEVQYAVELYQQFFTEKQELGDFGDSWNAACAISAVYNAGKINGIRAERERRRTGKKAHA